MPSISDYPDNHPSRKTIQELTHVLQNFHPPKLREVTVIFPQKNNTSSMWFHDELLPSLSEHCAELEKTLITFPEPTIVIDCWKPLNYGHHRLWMPILESIFPVLVKCCALKLNAKDCELYCYSSLIEVFWANYLAGHVGHGYRKLHTLIIMSPDSRWAATGSDNGHIIIWDLEGGCIVQEWFGKSHWVDSLAFSPDGRYVMLAGHWSSFFHEGVVIWDLQG